MEGLKNVEHPIRLYKVPPLPAPQPTPASPTAASGRAEQSGGGAAVASFPFASIPGLPAEADIEATVQSWLSDVIRAKRLIPLILGLFLLLSPAILVRTGGVLPTAGAILVSIVLGQVWGLRTGHSGHVQVALGVGIATGALLTGWSPVTNALFVLAGLIVAAVGIGGERRRKR